MTVFASVDPNLPKKGDTGWYKILSDQPRQENDTVTVSLNALDYEGQQGYLLFPKTTAVFSTANNQNASFVHGGNSLQERVIPILTVSHQQAASTSKILKYDIEAQVEPELFGFSRIKLKLKPKSISLGGLTFVGTDKVNLALRVCDRSDIVITIKEAVGVELKNQELYLQADETWVEVLFDLRGNKDERIRVEIFHPDNIAEIEPLTLTSYFNVSGALIKDKSSSEPALKSHNSDWQDSFEDANLVGLLGDDGCRRVDDDDEVAAASLTLLPPLTCLLCWGGR